MIPPVSHITIYLNNGCEDALSHKPYIELTIADSLIFFSPLGFWCVFRHSVRTMFCVFVFEGIYLQFGFKWNSCSRLILSN